MAEEKNEVVKRALFKLEVFDDFTVDSFYAIPPLGTIRGEPLNAKVISGVCEFLIELYRVGFQPNARKELLDTLDSKFRRGEK